MGPATNGLEKGAGRRPARGALLVAVDGAHAAVVAGVEIRRRRDAHFRRCLGDRVEHGPLHARLLDPPLATRAVMLGVAAKVVVEPLEDRADIVPTPTGAPELGPVIIVLRL